MIHQTKFHKRKQPDNSIVLSNIHAKHLKSTIVKEKDKKVVILTRSEEQKAEARKRCGRLYRKLKNLCWIIDDESIFKLSNSSSNRNSKFYTSSIRLAPEDVKYKKEEV